MNRQDVKVLIIDDEKSLLELLYQMLTAIGLAVELAESAEEGINKIKNTMFNVVLTDIKLPGMSGNEFFDYVKKNLDQSLPIIAMSGTPWLFEKTSFDAVIAKPFSREELLNVLRQFAQID